MGGQRRGITTVCEVLEYVEMGYPNYRQLLNALRAARQRASLTRPQLAERVVASRGFVGKYEGGKGPSRRQ